MSAGLFEARGAAGAPVHLLDVPRRETTGVAKSMNTSESVLPQTALPQTALPQTRVEPRVSTHQRLFVSAGNLYCRMFHKSISRPVLGKYRCWKCLREFDLEW